MATSIGEYLAVEELPQAEGRKTKRWSVIAKRSGMSLGVIAWYGPWRQYTFDPEAGTTFNVGCLNDIARFLGVARSR